MALEIADHFETHDGSRPEATPLAEPVAHEVPLTAFSLLAGGNAIDANGDPDRGEAAARNYVEKKVEIREHEPGHRQRVTRDLVRQLSGNPKLSARMERAKSIGIDIVPVGFSLAGLGYPPAVARDASGVFWDCPSWSRARLAVRADRLASEPALVVHEMAHAIHYLGFTEKERRLVYGLLRPTFRSRAAMDEVFAIYSGLEFLNTFSKCDDRAPGVYGFTRRQWNEDHVFTRFVHKLYWPGTPLPGMANGGDWMQGFPLH